MIFRRNKTKLCKFKHLKKKLETKTGNWNKKSFFPLEIKRDFFFIKAAKISLKTIKTGRKARNSQMEWANFVKKKNFENPKVSLVLT